MGLSVVVPTYVNVPTTVVPEYIHVQNAVCTESSSSSPFETTGAFDSTIYRLLSMRDAMKTLMYPTRLRTEFDRFLEAAVNKTNNVGYNVAFDNLDEYLGSLGVSNGIC